jgi:CelD/BcsL family acetyltransferase involved in cellulose biosynthesis
MDESSPASPPFVISGFRATVRPRVDPGRYEAELDARYSSLFSTVDWFVTHDDATWMGACELEEPRHVLVFDGKGDTIRVLNKAFAITPSDAERACRALFGAFPHVRRIHLEVLFPPSSLALPRRILYTTHHMVVDLPETTDAYLATLSKRMRKHLRTYRNRLEHDFSDIETEVFPSAGDERVPDLFDQFLRWKLERFGALGRRTYWQNDPRLVDRFLSLLGRRGEIRVTTVDGRTAAILFDFPVGDMMCAQESATGPDLDYYGMALLSDYWEICDAISRGFKTLNMLWGTEDHKARLGATRRTATALSVFADQQSRLWSLDEAWEVARRHARESATRHYWRTRHAAGRRLRARRGETTDAAHTDVAGS